MIHRASSLKSLPQTPIERELGFKGGNQHFPGQKTQAGSTRRKADNALQASLGAVSSHCHLIEPQSYN